jgi:hypothetical protein
MKLFLLASIIASVLALPDSSANDGPSSDDSGAVLAGLLGCESVYYVTFDGPVCGVIAFGSKADGKVTVQTIRDGITGLDESIGPFPYHGLFSVITTDDSPRRSSPFHW